MTESAPWSCWVYWAVGDSVLFGRSGVKLALEINNERSAYSGRGGQLHGIG